MSEDNGGPAFPSGEEYELRDPARRCVKRPMHGGMTLRDYFAANERCTGGINEHEHRELAAFRYRMADAMLEARK